MDVFGSEFFKLYKRQAATKDALRKWNKEVFGRCQDRINSLIQKIKEIQNRQPSRNNEVAEQALHTELSKWLIRSEVLWRQKSRELWLKLGDKDSKFFHLSTIIRRRNNNVDAIVGGKNLSSQLQNATSKFSGKFQINVIKLIKLDDDMCHPNWHHIGISKFATCHLAHRIKINSLFKIYG